MHNRAKLSQQTDLANLQHLLRARADQDLLEARQREAETLADKRRAEDRLEDATRDWMDCLGGASIDPQHLAQFAERITHYDNQRKDAEGSLERAAALTRQRQIALAESDARERQAGGSLTRLRRDLASDAEEAAMASLEDLTAYSRVML